MCTWYGFDSVLVGYHAALRLKHARAELRRVWSYAEDAPATRRERRHLANLLRTRRASWIPWKRYAMFWRRNPAEGVV